MVIAIGAGSIVAAAQDPQARIPVGVFLLNFLDAKTH
jgi:hypothetical protein